MIHNTYLVKKPAGEIIAHSSYWPVEVKTEQIESFIDTREEIQKQSGTELTPELPLSIGNDKFMASEIDSDLLLIFATDESEDEGNIRDRINEASKILTKNLDKGLRFIVDNYEELIQDAVTTRLKIALVGEGGVGKTTTLHLLLGDTPPLQYVPTIALNLETVENIRFGNYSLVLWDFAGQERFRKLWKFYFHGADVIFLVCDSTLRNVIISKDILKMIRRDAPKVPIFAIANKQDKPKAMKPGVIQKILGVPTYPMVAIDKDRREEMLRLLMNAAAQFVGVSVPDLPPSEVLTFVDAEPSEVIREIEEEKKEEEEEEEEELEVVETVLVDEEGRVVEESDGEYEVIEEVVEVVEEDTPEEESVSDISTETEIPTRTDVSEKTAEATVEDQAISIEQKGSEQKEATAFSLETTAEQAPISDEQTAEQIDIKW
ncbi:MAG: ADP-ribosylation factor-like protein, partial [Promethearchaeati archaeon]